MKLKEKLNIIKRSIKLTNKAYKNHLLIEVLKKVPGIVSSFLGIYMSALVIDKISAGKSLNEILISATIVCGIDFIIHFSSRVISIKDGRRDFMFSKNLRSFLWKKFINMDYIKVEDSNTHKEQKRAERYLEEYSGIKGLEHCLINSCFAGLIKALLGIILIAPFIFSETISNDNVFINFMQSIWGLFAVILIVILMEVFKNFIDKKITVIEEEVYNNEEYMCSQRIVDFYENYIFSNYNNGKDIRIYDESGIILSKYTAEIEKTIKLWYSICKKGIIYRLAFQIMTVLGRVAVTAFAVLRAIYGTLSAGEVVAFLSYFIKIQDGINDLLYGIFRMLNLNPLYCKYVFDFLDIPDEKYKGTIPTEKRDDDIYEFEFKHVYFKYPNTEIYVLKDVNLKWKIGEKMALVGRNGCGKSTLVKLLCRLYDPTEGEITLNGIDIKKYKYEDYINLFSVVFQDSKPFAFSIAENVAADTEYDAEAVKDCLKRSGLEKFNNLKKGIETCLYKNFDEEGIEISGGEAQKLMLARAIYKGSPFIILDEPTAALDPVSEHDIYTKFNSIVGTKTAVYISHRLSSCRFCDAIAVMDDGKIVEHDTHENLTNKGGVYKQMWLAQAEYYKDEAGELFV